MEQSASAGTWVPCSYASGEHAFQYIFEFDFEWAHEHLGMVTEISQDTEAIIGSNNDQ